MRPSARTIFAVLTACTAGISGASAQDGWPAKPVTVVVPFAAGGNVDVAARLFSERLGTRLGKQFIIENKTGAGGSTGIAHVQCLYHGLEFDASGACTLNPHPPGNIPSRAKVKSFTVVEKHKAIWIWMGDRTADVARIPDFSVLDNAPELYGTKRDKIIVKSNYELVVDNLLDLSHGCYLHEGLLGNADTVESDITVEQEGDDIIAGRHATNCVPPEMWAMLWPDHPPRVDKFSQIRWMAPSTLRLFVGVCDAGKSSESGTGYHAIHMLTPETDRTTHYFFTAVRFGVKTSDEALNREIQGKIAKMRRFAFEEQDAPVIEAQQQIVDEAPEALDPINLSIDIGPVRYKRVLQKMLETER